MYYGQDDLEQQVVGRSMVIPESPSRFITMHCMTDPFINAEVNRLVDRAVMLGVDLSDPEMMGNFFTDLWGKISSGAKGALKDTNISITQPQGTTTITDKGVDFTSAEQQAAQQAALNQPKVFTDYLKNPYVIAGMIGIPLLLIILSKRK